MKILIIGSDRVYAIENFYTSHLKTQGNEVLLYPAQAKFYDFYYKSIFNRLKVKLKLSSIYKQINEEILSIVETFKPASVIIFKGMEVFPETIEKLKRKSIYLVNYNPDNPFYFSGKGSGNQWLSDSVPLYDLHATYNKAVESQLVSSFQAKVLYLPFAFEPLSKDQVREVQAEDKINKVCFLGNPDSERAAFLLSIAQSGFKIDVYGNNWKKFVDHPFIQCHGEVLGVEFWRTLYKYRLQLNFMRPHNPDSHNMRSFETPGIGSIALNPSTSEHLQFFSSWDGVFHYSTINECCGLINEVLDMRDDDVKALSISNQRNIVSLKHTYSDRSSILIKHISSYI